MAKHPVGDYQTQLASRLCRLFPDVPVETEWAAITDEDDVYSPRLDVVVGPFATGSVVYIDEFNSMLERHNALLRALFDQHVVNIQQFGSGPGGVDFGDMCHRNANARCFLAFEIENRGSRKHLMGGAINAAALGRIGIAVAWSPDKLRAFVRLRNYLLFLARVGKNTFDPVNLMILSAEQLNDILAVFLPSRRLTRRSTRTRTSGGRH